MGIPRQIDLLLERGGRCWLGYAKWSELPSSCVEAMPLLELGGSWPPP